MGMDGNAARVQICIIYGFLLNSHLWMSELNFNIGSVFDFQAI